MTRYRVTITHQPTGKQHITVHADRQTAERYRQSYIDWQLINPDWIVIEEVEWTR